ncbi:MAG: ParB/RepB/Spo0J family partition protein [Planctomycetaceae bacterium]|nr:ParB/RepB/Spo0J family partition protein [Planctomycetaceae bacterium]
MPTADAVAAVSAIPKPRGGVSDEAAAAANGLRITTLMELESWCSDEWPDCEYWRCVVMAAAVDLCGQLFAMDGNYREAGQYLRWRRSALCDELRQGDGYENLQAAREHADDVISDEINLFLSRQFQEAYMATATRSASRATKVSKEPKAKRTKSETIPAIPETPPAGDEVAIDLVIPTANPRKVFNEEALQILAKSIAAHGFLHPLLVRPAGPDGRHELIAGERRLRAAKLLGRKTVPVRIVDKNDLASAAARLEENLTREDLNAIEEALGYQDMLDRFAADGVTQKSLGEQIGRSQSHISNRLRLLKAPQEWQQRLIDGEATDHHLWELVPFGDKAAVFAALNHLLKREFSGKVPDAGRFRRLVQRAVDDASRPLKDYYYSEPNSGRTWGAIDIKPTPAQIEELDVFEVKFDGDREKRCWNIASWEQIVTAQQQRKRDREAAAAEKAEKTGGKVTAAEQKKKDEKAQAVYAKKLFRYKLTWLQRTLVARLSDDKRRPAFLVMVGWVTFFATTPEGVLARGGVLDELLNVSGFDDTMQMMRAIAKRDPQELLVDLLRQWVSLGFEGYHPDIRAKTILALADQAGIDIKKEWQLDREFLEIHTRAQLDEIAAEWGDGFLPVKRAEAIDDLMSWKGKAKTPQRLVDCEAVSLT